MPNPTNAQNVNPNTHILAAYELVARFQPASLDMYHFLGQVAGFDWSMEEAAYTLLAFAEWGWVVEVNGRLCHKANGNA